MRTWLARRWYCRSAFSPPRRVYMAVRYYWPRAKMRRRVIANMQAFYAQYGETWRPPRPWWIP